MPDKRAGSDKHTTRERGDGGPAAPPGSTEQLRNVVLVGHAGSGKTTLVEALLVAAGAIPRPGRVEDGTTVSDFDEAEHRQGRSIALSVVSLAHDGTKVTLLDTPGYADFVGDLRAGLRAADAALFVVSAVDGIDGGTQLLWDECAAVGMPRAVVVTKLDHDRADFDETVAIAQRVFGEGIQPVHLPMADDAGHAAGLIGLLDRRIVDLSSGERVERDPDPAHLPLIDSARNALIEAVIAESEDETLMDRYLAGEEIDLDVLVADLETAVARGSFHPVLATAAPSGLGVAELLDLLVRAFPSPTEHHLPPVTTPDGDPHAPLTADPNGPLVAEVVKTTSDPYVGRLSVVRVFSGTLRPDASVHVSGHFARFFGAERAGTGHDEHDVDERIGAVTLPFGADHHPVAAGVAGDVVTVARLTRAETGDTLSDPADPLLMEPWLMPEPLLPVAIVAHSRSDEDKLSQALGRLVAEDPTMRLELNAETHQVVLWCMGEAHVDVLLDRLSRRYGVSVDSVPLRVSLRETFAAAASGHGRHVKQSGGHGQFAVCDLVVEPLPAGEGFEFVDEIVGGAVPRQFVPSVEKGVRAQMARGTAAGYPMVDLRVRLVDGKAHSVDSSDMAFQTAAGLALRDAAAATTVHLLEPVDLLEVQVADEYVGAVLGDLSARRGRVVGTEVDPSGRTVVRAEVPQIEITRYAVELRSISHGTGTFGREYHGHEPMPSQLAAKVQQEYAVADG